MFEFTAQNFSEKNNNEAHFKIDSDIWSSKPNIEYTEVRQAQNLTHLILLYTCHAKRRHGAAHYS